MRNPRIWLETVDEVRGNWIAGPDFAYRLCVDAFEAAGDAAIESLDLSCLRLCTRGVEPVRALHVCMTSGAAFRRAGFPAEAMAPQYGLAEAGLAGDRDVQPPALGASQLRCRAAQPGARGQSQRAIRGRSCGSAQLARW